MPKIVIKTTAGDFTAELNDSKSAQAIFAALPIEAKANTWGEEIYFAIPVQLESENPQEIVQPGDLGYWPQGNAFCIFFGPTPVSQGDEIRPASPVNPIGKVLDELEPLKKVRDGDRVRIEKIE